MSYLLKALEKAERERQAEASEDVSFSQRTATSSIPKWFVVLVLAILVLTLAQVFGLFDFRSEDTEHESLREQSFVSGKKTIEKQHTKTSKSEVLEDQEPQTYTLVELSSEQLERLPSIELQSHIYSTRSDMRSVLINNTNYEEGDLVASGVVLQEITNKGVVLSLGEFRVYLDKGVTWVAK